MKERAANLWSIKEKPKGFVHIDDNISFKFIQNINLNEKENIYDRCEKENELRKEKGMIKEMQAKLSSIEQKLEQIMKSKRQSVDNTS